MKRQSIGKLKTSDSPEGAPFSPPYYILLGPSQSGPFESCQPRSASSIRMCEYVYVCMCMYECECVYVSVCVRVASESTQESIT